MSSMRQFTTGATRNEDASKPDYEGFFSPLTVLAFGRYMNKNRKQADGKVRDSDNWQKGIPQSSYMKSLMRHVVDLWLHHRGYGAYASESLDEALGGIMFNANGYTHEHEKAKVSNDWKFHPGGHVVIEKTTTPFMPERGDQMDPVDYSIIRAHP